MDPVHGGGPRIRGPCFASYSIFDFAGSAKRPLAKTFTNDDRVGLSNLAFLAFSICRTAGKPMFVVQVTCVSFFNPEFSATCCLCVHGDVVRCN